jgi:ribosomal-protein-serine acetyltransferase
MTEVLNSAPPEVLTIPGEPPVYLKSLNRSDVPEICKVVEDNREFLSRYSDWPNTFFKPTAEDLVSHAQTRVIEGHTLEYLITAGNPENSGGMQGIIELYKDDERMPDYQAEIGYWLAEDAQGNGYVRRSAQEIVKHGQRAWGISEVRFSIIKANRPSFNVAHRLAEDMEALITYGRPVVRNAVKFDTVIMVLPPEDDDERS